MLQQVVDTNGVPSEVYDFIDCTHRNTELLEENKNLKEKNKHLKRNIEIKDNYCQLIADLGFDYDGFNQVDSLKGLIDELVGYAINARDNDDGRSVYIDGKGEDINILGELIGSDK